MPLVPYRELSEIQILINHTVTLIFYYVITDEQEKHWLLLSHFILRAYMNTQKNCFPLTRIIRVKDPSEAFSKSTSFIFSGCLGPSHPFVHY